MRASLAGSGAHGRVHLHPEVVLPALLRLAHLGVAPVAAHSNVLTLRAFALGDHVASPPSRPTPTASTRNAAPTADRPSSLWLSQVGWENCWHSQGFLLHG